MTETVTFTRGNASADGVTPFHLETGQQNALKDLFKRVNAQNHSTRGLGAQIYNLLLSYMSDSSGNRLPSVDPSVFNWLKGAVEANSGVGQASGFIRNYSKDELFIRTGNIGPTGWPIRLAPCRLGRIVGRRLLGPWD